MAASKHACGDGEKGRRSEQLFLNHHHCTHSRRSSGAGRHQTPLSKEGRGKQGVSGDSLFVSNKLSQEHLIVHGPMRWHSVDCQKLRTTEQTYGRTVCVHQQCYIASWDRVKQSMPASRFGLEHWRANADPPRFAVETGGPSLARRQVANWDERRRFVGTSEEQ